MDVGPGMGVQARDACHVACHVPEVGDDAPSGLFRSKKGHPGGQAGACWGHCSPLFCDPSVKCGRPL